MNKYKVNNDLKTSEGIIKKGAIVYGEKSDLANPYNGQVHSDYITLKNGMQFLDLNFKEIKK